MAVRVVGRGTQRAKSEGLRIGSACTLDLLAERGARFAQNAPGESA
ncbi:MAG: hypothetical protein HKUEN07_13030 [Rhodocyclaceae bacterium]|jgi:hypothetical protein|uniref:Uncharacterized protein n=1 Tax=Candidatus Desulfobacillus denitrificans TaxID=2608985 RepID=A0A809RVL1_9PROT|nr:hypothetical protein [Rhodocyclaceae bacterium]BBO20437.1 hypothetical protein DSYM_11360 [Candidatus Desulfobacillus denitrificans]GIK44491.1 MAG: hypothetical protein BroJett012_03940 [Betaproteobacteria bacterium]GJQ54734.1 MAG: hypothetical protein HKUEN07_13030 [Rhodocyclaceae bacterium]